VSVLAALAFTALIVLAAGIPLAHWSHRYWKVWR